MPGSAIHVAGTGAEALRTLAQHTVDVVFCDIKMPGLDGLDLGRVLSPVRPAAQGVFVTAYDEHAVDAFEVRATDYVMKPVRSARLAEAIRRVADDSTVAESSLHVDDETIPVELGGVTRFVQRSDVRYVEAQGDYARLHTRDGAHLVRIPLVSLEERWAGIGFRPDPPQHAGGGALHRRGPLGGGPLLRADRPGPPAGEPAPCPRPARAAPASGLGRLKPVNDDAPERVRVTNPRMGPPAAGRPGPLPARSTSRPRSARSTWLAGSAPSAGWPSGSA